MNFCKLRLILFFSLFALVVNGKSDTSLAKPGNKNTSSLFLFTAGYKIPVNKNRILNSGHGLYFEAGINPGKYLSKKAIVGFYLGWAWKDGLWPASFNSNFASDFNSSINKEAGLTSFDSTIVSASSQLISNAKGRSVSLPGCESTSFHNYSLYYGLMFKLPNENLPALKLYMGTTHSHYQGSGDIVTRQKDYNIFQLRRAMFGCELMMLKEFKKYKGRAALSVYFENSSFYNSTLYFSDGAQSRNIPLKKFMTSSFLQKYHNDTAWGLKISCVIF